MFKYEVEKKKECFMATFLQLFRVHKVIPNISYLNIPLYIVSIIEAKLLFTYLLLFRIHVQWVCTHRYLQNQNILFFFSVCCSPKRPAVTCINLVWRFTGLSSAQYGPPVSWSVSHRTPLSILFNLLHSMSVGKLFTKVTKAFHQVYLLLIILFHILM